jgi:uncharacterized cofD-like protein
MAQLKKKIVVIGGGTGSFVVLSGLKEFPLNLTAIVAVTDDGGSTGRLRDEFGFLPVGDMRQCIAALAIGNSQPDLTQKLLLYRFSKGEGLEGHNLGNLILTALEDLAGSESKALEYASKIFRLKGKVLPVSLKLVKLAARYKSGQTIISEHKIEDHKIPAGDRIIKLYTLPAAKINPKAKDAILKADAIILGPGDLFASTIANLVFQGVKEAIRQSKAKIIYLVNLMTTFYQTQGFTAQNHIKTLENYLGRKVDYILLNKTKPPKNILKIYQKSKEFMVKDDLGNDRRVNRLDLLSPKMVIKTKSDELKRSILRHDPHKVAHAILNILWEIK